MTAATTISISSMEDYVAYASSMGIFNDGQLLMLICIAAIMGLGKGGVPGFATVATAATVMTAPQGGLGFAVALQVPVLTMIDIYAAWLHAQSLDWPTVRLLLPLSFVGMTIGQTADRYLSDKAARCTVGIILLGILVLRTYKPVIAFLFPDEPKKSKETQHLGERETSRSPTMRKRKSALEIQDGSETANGGGVNKNKLKQQSSMQVYGWACTVGLVGGAATMLTNSMGPILNVYLLSVRQLSPASYIGTRAMFFCFLNVGKLPMRFLSGSLGWSMMPLACLLGCVSVAGVFCAKPIMMALPERTFVQLELAVVAFAGVRLLWMGCFS